MTVVVSMREALQGMQRIEQEIIDQVCARGTRLDASNFCWNYGRSRARLPSTFVHLEVRIGSKQTTAEWSRMVLQASRDRIDRMDVSQGIDDIVERLAPSGNFCPLTNGSLRAGAAKSP